MFKKVALSAVLTGLLLNAGCGKKMTCKSLADKNAKCMEAFMAVEKAAAEARMKKVMDQMPPPMKEKMKKNMAEQMKKAAEAVKKNMTGDAFVRLCEKEMKKSDERSRKDRKRLEDCFKKADCKAYVACLRKKD